MARSENPTGRLLSIHYLRAVAAVMVVVFHMFSHRLVVAGDPRHILWLKDGVAIFFVISGFVMVTSTADAPARPGVFIRRRLLRVVPLYWFLTLWYALITNHADWPHLVHSLLFLPEAGPAGAIRQPVIDAGWTLNYEMAFYALFALSMLLPRRAAFWTLCLVLALLAGLGPMLNPGPLAGYYLSPYWWEFLAGMLIARFDLRVPAWFLPIGLLLLAIGPAFIPVRALATSFPVALIVASARALDGTLRPWRLPMLLGDASYAIYLTHLLPIFVLANSFGPAGNPLLMLPAGVIGGIALGIAAHFGVEKPLAAIVRYRGHPAAPSALVSP